MARSIAAMLVFIQTGRSGTGHPLFTRQVRPGWYPRLLSPPLARYALPKVL